MKRASDICYARVSTYGQTLDAQLGQLRGACCTKIYREKVTGAHSDRRELVKTRKGLAAGDVVTVRGNTTVRGRSIAPDLHALNSVLCPRKLRISPGNACESTTARQKR